MDPATGEAVPASALRAELCGSDGAAAARALAALARAQASGADVSALAADCLPRLALSDELPLAARRMACDILRHSALCGAPFFKPCDVASHAATLLSHALACRRGVGGAGRGRRRRHRLRGAPLALFEAAHALANPQANPFHRRSLLSTASRC